MKGLFFTAALSLLLGSSANAQIATTTALVGTVTDASGKVVPDANVTAVNTGTRDTYKSTTNELGYYNIQFVRVGAYDLTVTRPGFQTYKTTGIQVETNQIVRNDVVLKVGELVETVTVEATTPAIKTDDASVSEIVGTRDVADLPLNGRDPLRLAISTPGVIPGLKGTTGVPPGQDFIGAGAREIQNSLSAGFQVHQSQPQGQGAAHRPGIPAFGKDRPARGLWDLLQPEPDESRLHCRVRRVRLS